MVRNRFGATLKHWRRIAVLAAIVVVVALSSLSIGAQPAIDQLTIVAPAAPGGGWDQLAREMQRELEEQRLAPVVQVENVPGAAGTIGLAQFINGRRGDGEALLVNGLVMLGAILWNESPVSLGQVTPIARLTGEYEIVAVPAGSPHHDMPSLMRALRDSPAAVPWGGGSACGTVHLATDRAAARLDPGGRTTCVLGGGRRSRHFSAGGDGGISGYNVRPAHRGRLRAIDLIARRPWTGCPGY